MDNTYLIQELIETKEFHELTSSERSVVLNEISEDEYNMRRRIIQESSTLYHSAITSRDQAILEKSKTLMASKESRGTGHSILSIFTFKIPFYIPAAAAALLFFILPFRFEQNTNAEKTFADNKDTVLRIVKETDTIIKEKETIKTVYVPVSTYVEVTGNCDKSSNDLNQGTDRVVSTNPNTVLERTTGQLNNLYHQSGVSSSQTEMLEKLEEVKDRLTFHHP